MYEQNVKQEKSMKQQDDLFNALAVAFGAFMGYKFLKGKVKSENLTLENGKKLMSACDAFLDTFNGGRNNEEIDVEYVQGIESEQT